MKIDHAPGAALCTEAENPAGDISPSSCICRISFNVVPISPQREAKTTGVSVPTEAMIHNEWVTLRGLSGNTDNASSHDRDFKRPLVNVSFVDGHVDKGRYENADFTGDYAGIRFGAYGFQSGSDTRTTTVQHQAWFGN